MINTNEIPEMEIYEGEYHDIRRLPIIFSPLKTHAGYISCIANIDRAIARGNRRRGQT